MSQHEGTPDTGKNIERPGPEQESVVDAAGSYPSTERVFAPLPIFWWVDHTEYPWAV
jgi:hypothetical protein